MAIILVLMISLGGVISYRLFAEVRFPTVTSQPPDHDLWDGIVKEFVVDGHVNYEHLLKNSEQLNIYLHRLQSHTPSSDWSREEKLAYWINAYNAFTIKIVLDNYPVKSIKDIGDKLQVPLVNSTWDIKFIEIGGKDLSLNDIEHRILRKEFNEPRIHFAIVCASESCPPLRSEAFISENIDKQLNEQALLFINDKNRNQLSADHIEISQLFSWFKGDFTTEGSLIDFLNKYSHTKISANAKISYLDYDWSLND
ncbi:MAG: DUF547 domain-containing protein [Bacteroidetes bacterium]|nr:MAG: DUF547 domain-containing protein [Bacteroidota bacterium]